MTTRTVIRVAKALLALVALLAVIVGVPVMLAAIGAVPHGIPSAHMIANSLTRKDDTGLYFRVFGAAAVWVSWAVFTLATISEVIGSIRLRGPRPTLPRSSLRRLGPAALVASIAVLFAAGPSALVWSAPQSMAVPTSGSNFTSTQFIDSSYQGDDPPSAKAALPTYEVQRYDTLWSIAQRHLPGDPALRYRDIRTLNPDLVGSDNEITTGVVLVLPADTYGLSRAGVSDTGEALVRPGDTLSGIAAEHRVADWHRIWPLNADRVEPGGRRLTDPNHIEPGWTVAVPVRAVTSSVISAPPTPRAQPAKQSTPLTRSAPPAPSPTPSSAEPSAATATPSTTAASPANSVSSAASDHARHGIRMDEWEAVFAGGGTLLAAGIFTSLRLARRRQFRYRRPGRSIRPTTPELISAEKAVITHGPAAVADVTFLDHALRSLSAACAANAEARMPDVVAARMLGEQLDVRIPSPDESPPPPWTVDESGYWWSIRTSDELVVTAANAERHFAPYPMLVAVGHEPNGTNWLLDLEAAGAVALTGNLSRCLDLGRFIAAELAVNAWSYGVSVTLVGFGEEMVALNPDRLSFSTDVDVVAKTLASELAIARDAGRTLEVDPATGRMRLIAGDSWMPHLLLVAPQSDHPDTSDELEQLLALLRDEAGRSTVAVVLAGHQPGADGATQRLTLTADGCLALPDLDVELVAEQLPADQGAALGQLLTQAVWVEDVPIPPSSGDSPYDRYIDAGGGLLPELTSSREMVRAVDSELRDPATDDKPGSATVLPADDDYLHEGAPSTDELQALAPLVTPERRDEIVAADPALAEDLADWLDSDSPTPKLTLLGPMQLRASGVRPAKRMSYHTEVAAFLATRDHGATAEQVAAAFDVATTSAYSRINTVRAWLGTNPRTGEKYLPDSTHSSAGKARGVGVYELVGVLVDADLFKRLRARGLALGGPAGLAYLQSALDLVAGQPFDQLRETGYGWLAETPLDHHLIVGIVDTAHTVHLEYLRVGALAHARAAAETALRAAPYEEIPRLDLVAVMKAEGLDQEANRYLREEVCNRTEGGQAPDDLPERTAELLRRNGWLSPVS